MKMNENFIDSCALNNCSLDTDTHKYVHPQIESEVESFVWPI